MKMPMDEQGAPKGCKRHRTLIRFFRNSLDDAPTKARVFEKGLLSP